ncbi:MFS transporter [Amycolatopsis jejuensis]|uniref:MFS transporter n=1 Tax=Amycolatopsis jejuensis TaxID=330084 RepID=UPI00068A1CE0|nr:MFS transporter [Amycolatopsis jejuensis]
METPSVETTNPAPVSKKPGITPRMFAALSIGTVIEWFDFGLFAFSATAIATTFFPKTEPAAALLQTFAVYGVAYVVRPLGGVVFGRIGDRVGRRAALSLSLVLMGVATAGIGLIPSYATIGLLAPTLLVLCRLLGGFSASSELTGAKTLAAESAPANRRGMWINFVGSFGSVGSAAATILVLIFRASPEAYAGGGWRWPFIIGGLVAMGGMFLRITIKESEVYTEVKNDKTIAIPKFGEMVRKYWRTMLVAFGFYTLVGVGYQTLLAYMPTYMTTVGKLSTNTALVISLFAFLGYATACTLFGLLTDFIGRKPVLIGGTISIAVITIPAYLLIMTGELVWVAVAQLLLVLPIAAVQAAGNAATIEVFPAVVRFSAVSMAYTFAYALFAGTAPLVSALLVDAGGDLMAAVYGVAIALVAIPLLAKGFPESYRFSIKTGRANP